MKYFRPALTATSGLLIAAYFAFHVNYLYPIVGWDHRYFFTRLLDVHLHYRINGLSIQWWTSTFGGGLPGYPHPLQAQFSLPQLLTLLIDPWQAILLSYFLYSLAGFALAYLFLRYSLQFGWMPSTLGAALFSANGFYLEHLANGHLNFQAFPLLPLFLVALFDRRLPTAIAIGLLSLCLGIFIYSASTYPLVFVFLSLLILLPLVYLIRPELYDWRRFFLVGVLGGALGIALCLSKLYAVGSFMRFFPRDMPDRFDVSLLHAGIGLLLQLVGVMGLAPILALRGEKMGLIRNLMQAYTGSSAGLWELDLSLSPVIWVLLLLGLFLLLWRGIRRPSSVLPRGWAGWLALALFAAGTWLALEFTFARGFFYPALRQLPFLKALHVNPRFGSAFIFPLALLAAWAFQSWVFAWSEKKTLLSFVPLQLLVILSLGAYLLLPLDRLQERNYDIRGLQEIYRRIEQGETFPIESVADITDQRVFADRASNIKPYEVLFGYNLSTFEPTVQPGPARELRDGFFNMTNPSSLVYPEANQTTPWQRIPASQAAELEDFLAHRQPDWVLSPTQHWMNGVSLLSLIATLLCLGWGLFRRK